MDAYRLKIRIGEHEFEAEGPQEAVERQFEAFKELITFLPKKESKQPAQDQKDTSAGEIGVLQQKNSRIFTG